MTSPLIDSIYARHCEALRLVACDTGPARMALWLALNELAERMEPVRPQAVADTQPAAPAAAPTSVDDTDDAEPQARRNKPGPKPGTRYGRKQGVTADEMAAHVAAGAVPVPEGAAEAVGLHGVLRREEQATRYVNGQPVQTTRQYIELR